MDWRGGLHIRDHHAGERAATYGRLDLHGQIDAGCLFITSIGDLLNLLVAEGSTAKASGRKPRLTTSFERMRIAAAEGEILPIIISRSRVTARY